MHEAFPLHWPAGYPRTVKPAFNPLFYKTTFAKERDALLRELKLLKATDIVLSTNIPLRQDGLPYADWEKRMVKDYGVAIYFKFQGTPSVLCCDAWDIIEDNVHAIVKTVDAMRGIDRWKVSEVLKRTFTGFAALPPTDAVNGKKIWEVLGFNEKPDSSVVIHQAYKELTKSRHPNAAGGTAEAWHELNEAYRMALSHFNIHTL